MKTNIFLRFTNLISYITKLFSFLDHFVLLGIDLF